MTTQAVVERLILQQEKKTRRDLGRETGPDLVEGAAHPPAFVGVEPPADTHDAARVVREQSGMQLIE